MDYIPRRIIEKNDDLSIVICYHTQTIGSFLLEIVFYQFIIFFAVSRQYISGLLFYIGFLLIYIFDGVRIITKQQA